MFRLHDNVPDIYVQESRDFQLISRIFDAALSGVKFDIDSIVHILDAATARDRILDLMCTKVGFFPRVEIDANVLKYIIASFPYIIKNKGNITGIQYAVNAILKAESSPDSIGIPRVIINNKVASETTRPYTVYIYTTVSIYNKRALEEVLRYVLPAGYMYQLLAYIDAFDLDLTEFAQTDNVTLAKTNVIAGSGISKLARVFESTDVSQPEASLSAGDPTHMLNYLDMQEVVPVRKLFASTTSTDLSDKYNGLETNTATDIEVVNETQVMAEATAQGTPITQSEYLVNYSNDILNNEGYTDE